MFFKKVNFCAMLVFGIVQLLHKGYSGQFSSVILKTSSYSNCRCFNYGCNSSVKINNSTFTQSRYDENLLVVLNAKTQEVTSYDMNPTIEEEFKNSNKTLTKYVEEQFKIPEGSVLFFLLQCENKFWIHLPERSIYKGNNSSNQSSELDVAIAVNCIDPCAFVTGEPFPFGLFDGSVEKNFQISLKVKQEKIPKKSNYATLAGILPALLAIVIALTVVIRYCKRKKLNFFNFKEKRQPFSEINFRKNAFTIHQSLNTIEHAVLPSDIEGKVKHELSITKKYPQTEVKNHYVSIKKYDSNNAEYEKIKQLTECEKNKQEDIYDYVEVDQNEKNTLNVYYCSCSPETVIMQHKKAKLQFNFKSKLLKLTENFHLNQKHSAPIESNDADVYEALTG